MKINSDDLASCSLAITELKHSTTKATFVMEHHQIIFSLEKNDALTGLDILKERKTHVEFHSDG